MSVFEGNFKELCRLCASLDSIKMDIFGEKGKEKQLANKIHVCLPLKVSEQDLLPKSICYRCMYNLDNFYEFRKGCVDAVNRLQNYVNETWGNALDLKYIPQKSIQRDIEGDAENISMRSVPSDFSDSQETPNPADFLEARMNNEPMHSPSAAYDETAAETNYDQDQLAEVDSGSFVCPSCPQSFSNMSALIIHSKVHLGAGSLAMANKEERRQYDCPFCDKSFVSKGNLSNHIKVHSGKEQLQPALDRPFRCELCSRSYTVAKHLWTHVSTGHRGDPRVTCQHCFRIFSTRQNLTDHCKTKHNIHVEPPYEDSFHNQIVQDDNTEKFDNNVLSDELSNSRRKSSNPRKINREHSLDAEISVDDEADILEEEGSISCMFCGHTFENRNDLRKHILVSHGIDPAVVGYPDLETSRLDVSGHNLDESEMAESMLESETVFCCEVCIREFNDRASLWLHMLYSHRPEAATACGICLRVCSDNVSLLEHVDSCHPRESMMADKRRYSCQICARQHDSKKKLLVHVKIHNLKDADGRAINPETVVVLNSDVYGPEAPSNECALDDEFSMSCEICYKTFPSEQKLIKHKRNAHKDSEAMHSTNSSATYKLFFPCEMCGLSHSTRTERWRHVFSTHADEPSLVCEREGCWKVFPTRALKYEHTRNHHELQGDSPNTCEICGKLWATRLNYWKHMMGVHADCLPFICGVCLKIFCNVGDLAAHVKERHYPLDNSEEFCCDICGRPYSKKSKMSRHRKIHNLPCSAGGLEEGLFDMQPEIVDDHEIDELKCKECPTEEFLDLEELSEHRRSAHNLVPCDLCPKFYGRTSHLWKHVYKIHKTHPDITCSICQKTSASKVQLAKHYAKHHRSAPEENNYVTLNDVGASGDMHNCGKCNKAFRKDHLMRQHMKHCTGPKPDSIVMGSAPAVNGSYPCEKCSKVFDTSGILRKHIKSSHIIYTCELCEKPHDSKTELFNHIKADHTNHPDLTCDVPTCLKMLRVKKDLIKHKREHRQGYPPPTCEFCGELLPNKIKLRIHLRANHAEQSKYMCSICTVSHLRFEDLQEHIKATHPSSVGKPTTCTICARKFPTKYKLENHLKVHGKEFLHCLTCFAVFRVEDEYKDHLEVHPLKKATPTKAIKEVTKVVNVDSDEEEEGSTLKRPHSPDSETNSKIIRLAHTCICCEEKFTTKSELSSHQLETHPGLRCGSCLMFFESEDVLNSHTTDCKLLEGRVKRKSALTPFNKNLDRVVASDDELSATNNSSVNSVDDNSSSSKDVWSSGKSGRKVYENDNTYSPCEHCEKSWPLKRALWQHYIRSHKAEAATTCGVCLKYCGSYFNLDTHLVEDHPHNFDAEDSSATCRVCGRYHNARHKLQSHASIHAGDEDRSAIFQYGCALCSKSFTTRGFLMKHEREQHGVDVERKYHSGHSEDLYMDTICSDDDGSKFEGFPDESCERLIPYRETLLKTVKQVSSQIEGKASGNSHNTELNESEEESDNDASSIHSESCEIIQEPDTYNGLPDLSNRSVSRESFGGVEMSIQDDHHSTSDAESVDCEEYVSKDDSESDSESESDEEDNASEECEQYENKEDSTRQSPSDLEYEESVEYEQDIDEEIDQNSLSDVDREDDISVDTEDNARRSNIMNAVSSFQSVSSINQCAIQSISLEDNGLACINDSNRYISQNITDSEMENLVT